MTVYGTERLTKTHDRLSFNCGDEILNLYLREIAGQDAKRHAAVVFVLITRDEPQRIRGFYTLSASSVNLVDLPDRLRKHLPRYPEVPVTLLGRSAVDLAFQGQGIGKLLLVDALQRSYVHSASIAAAAVVVDAKSADAERFYRHFGFQSLCNARLFLPMKTVAQIERESGAQTHEEIGTWRG